MSGEEEWEGKSVRGHRSRHADQKAWVWELITDGSARLTHMWPPPVLSFLRPLTHGPPTAAPTLAH